MGASLRVPNDDERLARGMPLASWPTSERRSEGSSRLEEDEEDEEDEELSRAGSEERFLSLSLRMVSGGGGVAASFSTGEPLPRTTRGEELKGAQAGLRTPQRDGRPERAASIRATRRLALMDGACGYGRRARASERYTDTHTSESETRLAEHTRRIYATNDESERAEKGKKRSIECVRAQERERERHDSAAGGDMAKVAMMVSVCVGERERGGRWLGGGADSLLSLALSPSFIAHTRRVASYVRRLLCALPFREPSTLRGDAPLGLRGSRGAFVCSVRPASTARDSRYLSTESGGCAQIS